MCFPDAFVGSTMGAAAAAAVADALADFGVMASFALARNLENENVRSDIGVPSGVPLVAAATEVPVAAAVLVGTDTGAETWSDTRLSAAAFVIPASGDLAAKRAARYLRPFRHATA